MPVRIDEAGLGTKIEVPTIDGRALLKIPQGTKNGQKFRLREKGVLNSRTAAPRRPDRRGRHRRRRRCTTSAPRNCCASTPRCTRTIRARKSGARCNPMAKGSQAKRAYMISAVAEQYQIHPQTLRLYEREGLLKPSRSDGNTRLYTDDDLERLEVILKLTRDLGVNLAGVEIILNMREKMAEMQRQIEAFVSSLNTEITSQRARPAAQEPGNSLIPVIQIRRSKKP